MFEAEILAQAHIHNLDRHGDEAPAPTADGCAAAAGANVVVVGHVDVKNELLGQRAEGGRAPECLAFPRVGRVHGADLEAGGGELDALFPEA